MVPDIRVSAQIGKVPQTSGDGWRYRIKIVNAPRRWLPKSPAVEIQVRAVLRVQGLDKEVPRNWTGITIPLSTSGINAMKDNRVLRLCVEKVKTRRQPPLPEEVRHAIERGTITLERLFELGSGAHLDLTVSATHAYSRARMTAQTRYGASSIALGRFSSTGLDVVENSGLTVRRVKDELSA